MDILTNGETHHKVHTGSQTRTRQKEASSILPSQIVYTSHRAIRACRELGIPVSPKRHDINRNNELFRLPSLPEKVSLLYTSQKQDLRHRFGYERHKRKNRPIVTIIIGRHRSDYVTTPHSERNLTSEMVRKVEEITISSNMKKDNSLAKLSSTKQVTFSEEVQIENYHPHEAIKRTNITENSNKNEITKVAGNCDETRTKDEASEKASTSVKTLDAVIRDEGLTGSGALPVKTDSKGGELSITTSSASTALTDVVDNAEKAQNVLNYGRETEELEKNEKILNDSESNMRDRKTDDISEKSAGKSENAGNFEGFWDNKTAEDTYELMAGKNKRSQSKKRFQTISTLPAIKEELTSQERDVTKVDGVINSSDVINRSIMDGTTQETPQKATVVSTNYRNVTSQRQELLRQTRENARISALRGQLAAERAALSCVVRYPRYAKSNLVYNPGVRFTNRRSSNEVLNRKELKQVKSNFLFHGGKKLDIYKPSFADRNRVNKLPTVLPPLPTSSASDVTLVSRRNSGVWVPDLSVVTGGQRKKLKPHNRLNTTRT